MQLLPHCHLVASGYLGFGLTSAWDGHAYLLVSEGEALLVDSGCGLASLEVGDRIEAILGESAVLVAIALTHSHVDHSGGAAALADRFGAEILAHPEAVDRIRTGDEDATGLTQALLDGVYPPELRLRSATTVRAIEERDLLIGALTVTPIFTPGHSSDHVVYRVSHGDDVALFTGDLVFAQGRVAILDTPDTDVDALAESIRTLREPAAEQLFPGHGAIALTRGWAHLDSALDAFDRGVLPEGLVP